MLSVPRAPPRVAPLQLPPESRPGLWPGARLEMPLQFLRGHPTSPSSELSRPLPAPPPLATGTPHCPPPPPRPSPAAPLSTLPAGTALEASSNVKMAEVSGLTRAAAKVAGMAPCYPATPTRIPSPLTQSEGIVSEGRASPPLLWKGKCPQTKPEVTQGREGPGW